MPAPHDADRALPSGMKSCGHVARSGKRALYGVVAGTCVLIGVAALVLQFATRPAPRVPLATATSPPASGPLASARGGAAALPGHRQGGSCVHSGDRHGDGHARPGERGLTARAPIKVASASAPAPAAAIAAPAPIMFRAPGPVPVERQGRCIEILQKASLEKITPAETEFFRKECK